MLKQLYESEYLYTISENFENSMNQFWDTFQNTLNINICGIDGKRRILSIIADKILYDIIKKNLL
ncbi:21988_t:CDS:1, partial [Dentiscutata erythropus]